MSNTCSHGITASYSPIISPSVNPNYFLSNVFPETCIVIGVVIFTTVNLQPLDSVINPILVSITYAYIHFCVHSPVILTYSGCHQRIIRGHSRYRQCSCGVTSLLVDIQHPRRPAVFWKVPSMRRSRWWKCAGQRHPKQNRMSSLSWKVLVGEIWREFW